MIVAPLADVQRWFERRGQGHADRRRPPRPASTPDALAAAHRAQALPRDARGQDRRADAPATADEINDAIGSFLTPALLAFAGAALLVGAFIIFNTFSITVAQRAREFALLRSLGATRRQVLAAVAGEALILGAAASVLGLVAGLGFARALGALFDAAGFGIPRSGIVLAPRTIVVSLAVGIGVTLLAALVPAMRATRVPPVAALRDAPSRRAARRRRGAVRSPPPCRLLGLALLLPGPVRRRPGDQPRSARWAAAPCSCSSASR